MNKDMKDLYAAMLINEGKVTRCEECAEGLYAIEYKYLNPFAKHPNFDESGMTLHLQGHMWVGDLSKLREYLGDLYWNDHEEFKWSDDDKIYNSLKSMVKREDDDATRNDRNISTDPKEGVSTKRVNPQDRRFRVKTISPEQSL